MQLPAAGRFRALRILIMVVGLLSGASAAAAQAPDSAVFAGLTTVAVGIALDVQLERHISADRLKP